MTFDEAMEQQTRLGLEKQKNEEQEKRDKQKAKAAETLEKLDALAENDTFKWFVDTYLEPMRREQHEWALDVVGKTPEQRNNAAQRYYQANEMLLTLERERTRISGEIAAISSP